MLRWLAQYSGQPIEGTVDLERDHVYRARWVVMNPLPLVTCASLPVGPLIQQILNVPGTGTAFPADLRVYTTLSGLPADWPANRKDVSGRAASECVVWAEMRAAADLPGFEINAMQQALAPFGGRMIDFWDETDDTVIRDNQTTTTPAQPPTTQPPPVTPPPPPTTVPPTPVPTTPVPTTTKPKKKPSEVIVPWALVIGGASLVYRILKG